MADQGYDYTQDQTFLSAPPEQQHAYLSANEPSYAQSHPDQQKAYLGHLNGGNMTEKGASAGQYDNPSSIITKSPEAQGMDELTRVAHFGGKGNKTPTNESEAQDQLINTVGRYGMAASLPETVSNPVGAAKAVVGGAAGAYAGGKVGGYLGGDTGEKIGKVGGGLVGGVFGGSLRMPEEWDVGIGKLKNPFYKPTPEEQLNTAVSEGRANRLPTTITPPHEQKLPLPQRAHAEMNEDIANEIQNRTAAKNQMDTDISEGHQFRVAANNEMNKDISEGQQERGAAKGEMEKDIATKQAKTPQAVAKRNLDTRQAQSDIIHGRPYEQLTDEEKSQALMRRGHDEEAATGTPTEGSTQRVTRVPEPNPVPPGEDPNNQQSVPRRTTLVQNAKRGKEGAGTQLNQIHGPVLYEPKGAGYGGERGWDPNAPSPVAPPPPEAPPESQTVASSKPLVQQQAGPNKVGAAPQSNLTPEEHDQFMKDVAADEAHLNAPLSEEEMNQVDALTDKMIDGGMSTLDASKSAEHTVRAANGKGRYNGIERRSAASRISRYMGPERRGK